MIKMQSYSSRNKALFLLFLCVGRSKSLAVMLRAFPRMSPSIHSPRVAQVLDIEAYIVYTYIMVVHGAKCFSFSFGKGQMKG